MTGTERGTEDCTDTDDDAPQADVYDPAAPWPADSEPPTAGGADVLEGEGGASWVETRAFGPGVSARVEGEAVVDGAGDGPFTGVVRLTLGTAAGEITVSLDTDDAQALADRLATAAIDARTCAEHRNDDY